jgi:hypothetical protein
MLSYEDGSLSGQDLLLVDWRRWYEHAIFFPGSFHFEMSPMQALRSRIVLSVVTIGHEKGSFM